MADAQLQTFGKRVNRINKQHTKLSRGYVTVVGKDGLLIARPRRTQMRFPWKALALLVALVFVFKAMIFASLGDAQYAERVGNLNAGTSVEQVGGWVMQADPLTIWLAELIGPLI